MWEGWAVVPRRPRGHFIRFGAALCKGTIVFRRAKGAFVPQPLPQYQCKECQRKLASLIRREIVTAVTNPDLFPHE